MNKYQKNWGADLMSETEIENHSGLNIAKIAVGQYAIVVTTTEGKKEKYFHRS